MSERIIHTSDDNFESEVLKAEGPVLVDFWAEWCGPCKMIAPVLDQVAEQYGEKLTIAKVDVDGNKQTAMKYSVRSIPTLMLFKDGELVDTKMGAMSKGQLTEFIDGAIA
ncbi:MAG: thioredoxin TrxA [Lysobacterales bacterium]